MALDSRDAFAQVAQVPADAVQAAVHLREALINLNEAVIDLREAGVHLRKPSVHLREALIHSRKAASDFGPDVGHVASDFGANVGHVAALLGLPLEERPKHQGDCGSGRGYLSGADPCLLAHQTTLMASNAIKNTMRTPPQPH